ncbi:MAG TPA: polysaccharide deacetylase family protein, partial [Armatimonadota bacterium]
MTLTVTPNASTVTAPVTLTAAAQGITTPQYEFWAQAGSAAWEKIRMKSAEPTCIWGPATRGSYAFMVCVSDGATPAVQAMAVSSIMTVNPVVPSGVSLTISPTRPKQLAPVIVTAKATSTLPLEYAFAVSSTSGQQTTWQILQPFSSQSVYTWTPVNAGAYTLEVLIRTPSIPEGPLVRKTLAVTVATNAVALLSVATFSGDRSGAISYTFDDGYQCEADVIAPLFSEFGLHASFYIVINWTPEEPTGQGPAGQADWGTWWKVLSAGHEVGSHTMNHVDLTTVNSTTLQSE